jgi:hypothetical protein
MSEPHPHTDKEPCPGGCEDIKDVDAKFDAGTKRMTDIEASLTELGAKFDLHIATSQATNATVLEVLDILHAGKGFFRVLGYIATGIKWIAGLAAPIIGLYIAMKDWPKH